MIITLEILIWFMRDASSFSAPFSLNCFFSAVEPLLMLTACASHSSVSACFFIFKDLTLQRQMLLLPWPARAWCLRQGMKVNAQLKPPF